MNKHVRTTPHSATPLRTTRLGWIRTGTGVAVAALVGVATFAGLAGADTAPVYPPVQSCSMQGQPASSTPGATVVITGTAAAGAAVSAILSPEGVTIGSTVATSTGAYTISANIPTSAHAQDAITVGGVTCAAVAVLPPAPTNTPIDVTSPVTPSSPARSQAIQAITVTKSDGSMTTQPATTPLQASPAAARSHPLAFTGASVLVPGALGVILLGVGAVLFLLGRRGKPRHN